jgi:hypothetical protein
MAAIQPQRRHESAGNKTSRKNSNIALNARANVDGGENMYQNRRFEMEPQTGSGTLKTR